jgi:hypothetical protein
MSPIGPKVLLVLLPKKLGLKLLIPWKNNVLMLQHGWLLSLKTDF